MSENDKEFLKDLVEAEYILGEVYKVEPKIVMKFYWEIIIESRTDKNYLVFLKNRDLLGRVALQGVDRDIPELAIVIVKKYQGQGYSAVLLKQWLNWVHKNMGYSRINMKIDAANEKSKGLFKKIGAVIDDEDEENIIYCHLNLPL